VTKCFLRWPTHPECVLTDNFQGVAATGASVIWPLPREGALLMVRLEGTEHVGHAVAHPDENGHVTVGVRLAAS
jgi:hypothetical protein